MGTTLHPSICVSFVFIPFDYEMVTPPKPVIKLIRCKVPLVEIKSSIDFLDLGSDGPHRTK